MLCQRIRKLREAKGVLQAEVSEYLNITRASYSAFETGKRQMNYETLCLLADYFEVSTDYLLGRQEAIPSFLSEEEREIIEKYRGLDEHTQAGLKNTLDFEYSRAHRTKDIKKSAM